MSSRQPQFLVQLCIGENDRVDRDEVGRMIEYLGGIAMSEGFAFYSSDRRCEALKILSRTYGNQHFACVDSREDEGR